MSLGRNPAPGINSNFDTYESVESLPAVRVVPFWEEIYISCLLCLLCKLFNMYMKVPRKTVAYMQTSIGECVLAAVLPSSGGLTTDKSAGSVFGRLGLSRMVKLPDEFQVCFIFHIFTEN